ncbi:hypothetical protein WJX77_012008 [Trebouxia sp. C0004]
MSAAASAAAAGRLGQGSVGPAPGGLVPLRKAFTGSGPSPGQSLPMLPSPMPDAIASVNSTVTPSTVPSMLPYQQQHAEVPMHTASPQEWVTADMQAFVVWVSTHDFMQSQIEAEDVAQSGIVDCFDLAQELLSSTALLQPFLDEWTGPLPQGFSAIAAAKGIALKQPLSLAPALLQAMRQNLRRTSLSVALQAMKAGYTLALAALCSAPQAPQLLQGSLPQGPQLGATQPYAPQGSIMSGPAHSDLIGATALQPHAASMPQQPSSVVWEGTNQQPPHHPGHCQAPQARASAGAQQSVAKPQESDDISCAQGHAASPVLAEQTSRNSSYGLNQSASGKAGESDPDFARLGWHGPSGGVSAGQAQVSGSRPNGHVSAVMASNKSAESDKENAAAVNPKRIHKSKAAAAAEADRESKRSKAVSADEALAEAKAAALASGWDSDDDFETLPKR